VLTFTLGGQILSIACDNASANDKMITTLARTLPRFAGEKSRVRCFLHIVNLIAKATIRQFDASRHRSGGLEVDLDDEHEEEEAEDSEQGGGDEADDDSDDSDGDDGDDGDGDGTALEPVRVVLSKVCSPPPCADVS
jgi:hypothetical protein